MSNIPPFTRQEAEALRGGFISLIIERDQLAKELEAHRAVLAELEDLRQFIADVVDQADEAHVAEPIAPPGEDDQDEQTTGETETAKLPPEGSPMRKILDAIEESDRPQRGWQIQKQLGLSRMPSAELSRLVRRGHLERRGEGIFAVAGKIYNQSST
jgi:hypothetical protein